MLKNINIKNLDIYNSIIIDIRDKEKYNTSHIPNSINIDMTSLLANPEKYLNYDDIYYIYCQHGKNSIKVCINLSRKNYKTVNIMGGYDEWLINS